jgi:hypothetical protein
MAWAWSRIADPPGGDAGAQAAFWRWVWPEFEMRMSLMHNTLAATPR